MTAREKLKRSGPTGVWDMYSLVPLTGDEGAFQIVTLAGTRTLRTTTLAGNNDFDYLVFLPATGTPPPLLRPANTSAPVWLEAGRRYYIEALMKEGGVIACDTARHPFAPMNAVVRAGLLETARRLDPLVLRWAR